MLKISNILFKFIDPLKKNRKIINETEIDNETIFIKDIINFVFLLP
jgi:hypothetical protein